MQKRRLSIVKGEKYNWKITRLCINGLRQKGIKEDEEKQLEWLKK
jgi:hypothetical protein